MNENGMRGSEAGGADSECGRGRGGGNVEGGESLVLAGDLGTQFVPKLVGHLEEDLDDGRVELTA